MKQAIIRKELTGDWCAFTFPERGKQFYIKNFSEAPVYISFAAESSETSSFKLNGLMGEEFQMSYAPKPWPFGMVYTVYIKGEGEVEVQSEDIVVPDDWQPEE